MRPIDADELMEHVGRDRLDSRELIAQMIANAPTLEQKDPIDMSADDLTDLARKYKVRIEIEFEPDGYGKVRRKMTISRSSTTLPGSYSKRVRSIRSISWKNTRRTETSRTSFRRRRTWSRIFRAA